MDAHKERRRVRRSPVNYDYFATYQGSTLIGTAHDISAYGVGILAQKPLEPKQPLEIHLVVPKKSFQIASQGIVVHNAPVSAAKGDQYLAGIEFTESLGEKLPLISAKGKVSRHTPSHTVTIEADAATAYRLLADYERYPKWTSGVKQARVLDSYPDGRGRRVEFLHDFFFHTARYILEYSYDDEHTILSWVSAGGDEEIMSITGRYIFKAAGPVRCYATYELDITLGVIPSTRLAQYVTTIMMRSEMKNFRNFVEKYK